MRYKVMWLMSWITMTLWLGNISGCSTPPVSQGVHDDAAADAAIQKEAQEWSKKWRPPADDVQPSQSAATTPVATTSVALTPKAGEATPDEVVTTPVRCGPMAAGDVCQVCQGEVACAPHQQQPIVTTTMNRGHWPQMVVKAEAGQTRHWPVYFNDCPVYASQADPAAAPGTEASIHAALADDRAAGASFVNMQAVPTQPIKAAFDLVTLPVRAIFNPPWVTNTSP